MNIHYYPQNLKILNFRSIFDFNYLHQQFFTFFDNVYTKDLIINPSSGFGIRVFDGKFFYDVSLGFPLGELREAKLHIKFNTRL